LDESGTKAAESVKVRYETACKLNKIEMDPYELEIKQKMAYDTSVKHRKRIKGSHSQRAIYAYTAKQIPLCKNHHLLVHAGKYDGPSLRKLPGYTPSDFDR